jgi:RsiW-degrading membrane proteinase PrsW (M82 family)
MFPLLLTILAAITPTVLLVTYFAADHRFLQPRRVIWATFILGVVAVVPVTVLEIEIHGLLTALVRDPVRFAFYKSFLAFALPEEIVKFLVLRFYCMRVAPFAVPKDGLVYGATVSLGFSVFESVFYFAAAGPSWYLVIMRGLMAMPMHAAVGVIMGLALVYLRPTGAKRRKRPTGANRGLVYAFALGVPIVFHGLYNFFLLLPPYVPAPSLFERVHGPQPAIVIAILAATTAFVLFRHLSLRLGIPAPSSP